MYLSKSQDHLKQTIGGRSIEVISDKKEALVGIFETDNEDSSPINWTRNQWFIVANRDSLRHDFYHSFLEKILERFPFLERLFHLPFFLNCLNTWFCFIILKFNGI